MRPCIICLIPLRGIGACGAEAFKLLCTELLKRSSFLFFPAEEKKPMGVGPPRPKNPIGSEFPPMLRQEAAYIASAMLAASFLASKEIPLIQSDNGRGGPTPAKEKKAPAGQNLPVLRALFCSAVNAFPARADTYSDIYPSVPLTAARRKRAPSAWRAYRDSPPANFAQPGLSTDALLLM